MDNTTSLPANAPYPSLPSPTVQMLTCVNYLIRPKPGTKPAISTVKGVLAAMAQHVNRDGLVFLSVERMTFISGYAERAVRKALRYAEQQGYIQAQHRGGGAGKATSYRVLLLARYVEAAAINREWHSQKNPAFSAGKVIHNPAPGAGYCKNYPAFKTENPAPGTRNPALKAPNPNLEPIENQLSSAVRNYEETKRYLAKVFGEDGKGR